MEEAEGKIPPQLREDIIRESLICGYEEARYQIDTLSLPSGVRDSNLLRLAESLGIQIRFKKADNALSSNIKSIS